MVLIRAVEVLFMYVKTKVDIVFRLAVHGPISNHGPHFVVAVCIANLHLGVYIRTFMRESSKGRITAGCPSIDGFVRWGIGITGGGGISTRGSLAAELASERTCGGFCHDCCLAGEIVDSRPAQVARKPPWCRHD